MSDYVALRTYMCFVMYMLYPPVHEYRLHVLGASCYYNCYY